MVKTNGVDLYISFFSVSITMWGVISILPSLVMAIFLFVLYPLGIKLYVITNDRKKTDLFYSNAKRSIWFSSMTTYTVGEVLPAGVVMSGGFVGYITNSVSQTNRQPENSSTIYLLTTIDKITELLTVEDTMQKKKAIGNACKEVSIIERDGNFNFLYYITRTIFVSTIKTPRPLQKAIVAKIIALFKEKNFASTFVYGPSGTGKTTLGLLTAMETNGCIVTTFNPSEPGDNLQKVVKASAPKSSKPLIVVLDEVDVLIRNIHNNLIQLHKNIPTAVYDKRTFNKFFDDLFLFPNVIIIMTSNVRKDEIDKMDPSYLREKQVDFCAELV